MRTAAEALCEVQGAQEFETSNWTRCQLGRLVLFSTRISRSHHVRSTLAAHIEGDEEQTETQRGVKDERRYQIDLLLRTYISSSCTWLDRAVTNGIMNDKKHMTRNGLINEVTFQLTSRSLRDPMDIKERIEAFD